MTVRQKQCLLSYLGYYDGNIDGIWGEKSRQGTEVFQQAYGLKVDGVFGNDTENRIREVIASGAIGADGPAGKCGTFWEDIRYFTRDEPYIGCPCGQCGGFPVEPSEKLMRLADQVREHFGVPMVPTSTVRCQAHNAQVGGVWNSRHLSGKAMDFVVQGVSPDRVLSYVQSLEDVNYAYVISGSAVHMDVQ